MRRELAPEITERRRLALPELTNLSLRGDLLGAGLLRRGESRTL
jgi:hypothetical protein